MSKSKNFVKATNKSTRSNKMSRGKHNPKVISKRNFQDEFADEEYQKGKRSAKFPLSTVKPSRNDPQWYFKDPQILRDVASFSYSTALGRTFNPEQLVNDNDAVHSNWDCAIPGVMNFLVAPTVGIANNAQDPINLAATNVYSYVRYKNSGAANYDSPDLMLYLVAMDSIYACWNWLKRIYGMASTYSQTNLYAPKAWLAANNVDIEDLFSNLAQFRAWLNIKANEISAFCVPATMTYNVRHSWMFSNIYKDGDTDKAQTYMYSPALFFKYDETSSPQGGVLTPVPVLFTADSFSTDLTPFKVADLKKILNSMLQAVNYSEDIGIISGDILKAYGPSGLFKISTFDEDYRVEPVYSEEVLSQIENLMMMPGFNYQGGWAPIEGGISPSSFTIRQNPNTNYIIAEISTTTGTPVGQQASILNFHHQDPTPEQAMVASRLKLYSVNKPTGGFYISSCGSEIVLYAQIWFYAQTSAATDPYDPTAKSSLQSINFGSRIYANTLPTVFTMIEILKMLSMFDWHPYICVDVGGAGSGTIKQLCADPFMDVDKYTILYNESLAAMNTVALLTEFNVPN